jgi:hypothetical protein
MKILKPQKDNGWKNREGHKPCPGEFGFGNIFAEKSQI